MKCVICGIGDLVDGTTIVTRQRADTIVVLKDVPVLVCDNCGEEYLDEATTDTVQEMADTAAVAGVEVVVRAFHQAA
ncbi:MAG: type II toxin-antitoxin system MqsA family antitoxin [Armatimonadetes bacterium]|nr:type II toxin-antitoxin system MqsA family antitoxin [Armatimonadota bacterium]